MTVEDDAGGSSIDLDDQREHVAGSRVERGDVRAVVGDPPRRRGTRDEAPGVHEVRVHVSSLPRDVRHEILDPVAIV